MGEKLRELGKRVVEKIGGKVKKIGKIEEIGQKVGKRAKKMRKMGENGEIWLKI